MRYHYYVQKEIINEGKHNDIYSILCSRIGIEGVISDDWKYMAMFENYKSLGHNISSYDDNYFSRAWIEGHIGKTNITLGRFNYISQSSNILV